MTAWRLVLVVLGLAAVLGTVSVQAWQRQQVIEHGRTVLLPLRPLDPRSLMQGDYMRLAFEASAYPPPGVAGALPYSGRVAMAVDDGGAARFAAAQIADLDRQPRSAAIWLDYVRTGDPQAPLRYAADSFLFEEGHAAAYAEARYAVLRVAPDGAAVLVALAGPDRRPIRPGRE